MVMLRQKKLPTEMNPLIKFDSDLDEFPWFLIFLEDLHKVRFESRIWEAFKKWSCLSENEAIKVLTYGTYPYINVKGNLVGSTATGDHGHFKPSRPHDIWIRRDEVQRYEKTTDPHVELATGKYLEYLILHELVHWGRHLSGAGDDFEVTKLDPNNFMKDFDSGNLFGEEAYKNFYKPHLK